MAKFVLVLVIFLGSFAELFAQTCIEQTKKEWQVVGVTPENGGKVKTIKATNFGIGLINNQYIVVNPKSCGSGRRRSGGGSGSRDAVARKKVDSLSDEVAFMKEQINDLQKKQSENQGDITQLTARVDKIDIRLTRVENQMDSMYGVISGWINENQGYLARKEQREILLTEAQLKTLRSTRRANTWCTIFNGVAAVASITTAGIAVSVLGRVASSVPNSISFNGRHRDYGGHRPQSVQQPPPARQPDIKPQKNGGDHAGGPGYLQPTNVGSNPGSTNTQYIPANGGTPHKGGPTYLPPTGTTTTTTSHEGGY